MLHKLTDSKYMYNTLCHVCNIIQHQNCLHSLFITFTLLQEAAVNGIDQQLKGTMFKDVYSVWACMVCYHWGSAPACKRQLRSTIRLLCVCWETRHLVNYIPPYCYTWCVKFL